jgi:hypothetical protein
LTCFTCKYSVKRKAAFIALVGGDGTAWKRRYHVGQLFCWRRGKKGMWVSKKNIGCELGYQPAKNLRGGLRNPEEIGLLES